MKENTEGIWIYGSSVAAIWTKNVGSRRVFMFVTWDPEIMLQAVNNLNVISETKPLKNV